MNFLALVFVALLATGSSRPTVSMRSAAYYCSFMPLGEFLGGASGVFVGTATADSVAANGAHRNETPRWLKGLKDPPFMQVIQVERPTSRMGSSLLRSLKESRNRVVIVPWGYGADCHMQSSRGPALWAKPNRRGVFSGAPRSKSDWIGGLPTFDATYDLDNPYPGPAHTDAAKNLDASELLSLVDSIPPLHLMGLGKVETYHALKKRFEALFLWASAHPSQAKRMPASQWIESGKDWLARAALDTIVSPFAGTYRFVLSMPQSDSIVFYGRSQLRPLETIWQESARTPKRGVSDPFGYYLMTGIEKTVDGLPGTWPALNRGGYIGAGFKPVFTSRDSTVWAGELDVFFALESLFVKSPAASKLAHVRKVDTDNMDVGSRSYLPARIVRRRDGALELNRIVKEGDLTIATFRGKRISNATFDQKR